MPQLNPGGAAAVPPQGDPAHRNVLTDRRGHLVLGGPVFDPRAFGAKADGGADDTAAIEAAWEASGRSGPLHFSPGHYVYRGPGLRCLDGGAMVITGSGRRLTRIVLGPRARLIDLGSFYIDQLVLTDLSTEGGLGAFRSLRTEANSGAGQLTVARCLFHAYTEAAFATNSCDFPFVRIEDCEFYGTDQASIGVALSGWTDGSVLANCSFWKNRVNVKLRGAGANMTLVRCNFMRAAAPSKVEEPRIDLWVVPSPVEVNGGYNCILSECRFGNESLAAGDYRIVYADESAAGADHATRAPALDAASSGFVIGHRYESCGLYGSGAAPLPWIYSTTPNVLGCTFGPLFVSGTAPTRLLEFRTVPPGDARGHANLFGPVTGDAIALDVPMFPASNAPGAGFVDDPNEVWTTLPEAPLARAGGGDPVGYTPLCRRPMAAFLPATAAPKAVEDGHGGLDAVELTLGTKEYTYAPFDAAHVQINRPAWVEFDLKAGSKPPLAAVLARIGSNAFETEHWRRIATVSPSWTRHRYLWVPRARTATYNIAFQAPAGHAEGTVQIGRVRIYHAREPLNVDGQQVAVRSAGVVSTRKHTPPADADLVPGEAAFWFDPTPGAAKLMVRARDADGNLVSGAFPLAGRGPTGAETPR